MKNSRNLESTVWKVIKKALLKHQLWPRSLYIRTPAVYYNSRQWPFGRYSDFPGTSLPTHVDVCYLTNTGENLTAKKKGTSNLITIQLLQATNIHVGSGFGKLQQCKMSAVKSLRKPSTRTWNYGDRFVGNIPKLGLSSKMKLFIPLFFCISKAFSFGFQELDNKNIYVKNRYINHRISWKTLVLLGKHY